MPKQYLPLQGQPIALYSLDVFAAMREVGELVVVCDRSYDALFREHHAHLPTRSPPLVFARPGAERQDSVSNGFEVRVPPHTDQDQDGIECKGRARSGLEACLPTVDVGQDSSRALDTMSRTPFSKLCSQPCFYLFSPLPAFGSNCAFQLLAHGFFM